MSVQTVGVDLGGTWIRILSLNAAGHAIRTYKTPAVSKEALPRFLKHKFQQWKLKPYALGVASRGVWSAMERETLTKALRGLAPKIIVISDVEAAWTAAFGKGHGILILSGTGSIAYGRDARGRVARAGGLGPWVGDAGSAFWIGKEWLKSRGRSVSTRGTRSRVRQIAALAPHVLRQAQRKQAMAQLIISNAQMELAGLVIQLGKKLSWKGSIPVSWAGSVLENPSFRRGFWGILRKVQKGSDFAIRRVPPRTDAVHAITHIAHAASS